MRTGIHSRLLAAGAILAIVLFLFMISRPGGQDAPAVPEAGDLPHAADALPEGAGSPGEHEPDSSVPSEERGELTGTAFYASTGCPASGVQLWAYLPRVGSNPLDTRRVHVGPDGTFRMKRMLPGPWRVRTPLDTEGTEPRLVEIRPGEEASLDLVIPPVPGAIVSGVVRDAHSGRLLRGGYIFTPWGPAQRRSGADGEGRYEMHGVKPGEWPVTAAFDGYRWLEKKVTVTEGTREVRVDFDLVRTPDIRGRVTDEEGRPLSGARVGADFRKVYGNGRVTRAAADGTFVLRGPGEGETIRVFARAPGFAMQASPGITVSSAGAADTLHFELQPAAVLSGRLTSTTGIPVARPYVTVETRLPGGGWAQRWTRAKPGGTYRATDLVPGPSRVHVFGKGHSEAIREDVVVAAGPGETTLDFHLSPEVPMAGVVRRPNGDPVAGARLEAWSEDRDVWQPYAPSAITDGSSRFSVPGLRPGTHRILITHIGRTRLPTPWAFPGMTAGTTDLVLTTPEDAR